LEMEWWITARELGLDLPNLEDFGNLFEERSEVPRNI
jgi:hypothetical protein